MTTKTESISEIHSCPTKFRVEPVSVFLIVLCSLAGLTIVQINSVAAKSSHHSSHKNSGSDKSSDATKKGAKPSIEKSRPVILEVFPDQVAAKSGIKSGDKIICASDQMVSRAEEFIRQVHLYRDAESRIILKRGNETITKTIKPNAEGRVGVRISDMNDAIVSKQEKNGAPTCQTAAMVVSILNATGAPPVVTNLKPGTPVKVLYEEPQLVPATKKPVAICKIRLEANTTGLGEHKIPKGDWFTSSTYLQPSHIAPGPTTKDKPVTLEQSESLKAGMTLAAVRGLLGSTGNFLSRDTNIKGVVGQTIVWQNPDGSNLCCNFENDRLVYKSAFLLK
ncbi:MAG: hypothetical protein HYX67_01755 [Candidatus Melainabacteria bacterium]|nr:hypothetical protein [Candidatus Melainabacteria bacterium]